MNLILTLLDHNPYLEYPYILYGWIGWFAIAAALGYLTYRLREAQWIKNRQRLLLFLVLLVLTPLTSLLGVIEIQNPNPLPVPLIPQQPTDPFLMILGMIPWVLAAGFLGPAAAVALAVLSGLFQAYWGTHNIFTILEFGTLALAYAYMIRQRYRTTSYRLLRHPVFSAPTVSIMLVPFYLVTAFLATNGELATRIDYAITQSWFTVLTQFAGLFLASLVAEAVYLSKSTLWGRRAPLEPSPSETNLQARFLTTSAPLFGVLFVVLMVTDWIVAGNAARNMIEQRLSSTTQVAAQSLPYFLESGQNLILTMATEELANQPAVYIPDRLAEQIRAVPYFRQLFLFDRNGIPVGGYPIENTDQLQMTMEEKAGIPLSLRGVPVQTYTLKPWPGESTAQVSFLAAIRTKDGQVVGVLLGRTDLSTNPFTQPAIEALQSVKDLNGEGVILDENNQILYHSNSERIMDRYIAKIPSGAEFYPDVSSLGTRQYVFYRPVVGRPWSVLLYVPRSEAQQLALEIAIPLLLTLLLLAAVAFILLRLSLNAITSSLQRLAVEATNISQGQLDHALVITGEDEIGQFGRAFEKMRLSLKARLDELKRLLKVSQGVAAHLEVGDAVQPILEAAMGNTASMARIVLTRGASFDPHDDEIRTMYGYGPAAERFSYLDDQIFELMQQQTLLSIPNASRTRRLIFPTGKPIPGAIIAQAVHHENLYYGVLWMAFDDPQTFSDEDVRFLNTLAGQVALAASNSRLYSSAEIGRQRLEAVLASTPEPVLVIDEQMRLLLLNPAALQVPGLIGSASPRKPIREVIQQDDVYRLVTMPTDEGVISREITLPGGRIFYTSVSPVLVEGQSVGKICILRDVTHYKELDSLKSDFVSTVSHDLRSPLTLMRGYATMIQMVGELNEQQKNYINKIVAGVDNISRLVNNLLDLGRIETGVGLKIEEIQLTEVIETVINQLSPQASQNKVRVQYIENETLDHLTPIKMQADPALVQQAIYNLVENAIKYTQVNGEVRVKLNAGLSTAIIEVRDTGIGIAPLDLPHMFEKFYRSGRREAYQQRGTGLGLAIVKSIAERHQGKVWVESQLGRGSVFFLELPYVQHPQPKIAEF